MRLAAAAVDDYVSRLVELLERCGVVLSNPAPGEPAEVLEADDGSLSFELIGSLPDGPVPGLSTLEVRERFRTVAGEMFERDGYEYELIDRARDLRRAFHYHDSEWFERHYLIVVHEHCERPIGDTACDHYHGSPIRDAYAGVMALLEAWTSPPSCSGLRCL